MKNGVKNIQATAYNGVCMLFYFDKMKNKSNWEWFDWFLDVENLLIKVNILNNKGFLGF